MKEKPTRTLSMRAHVVSKDVLVQEKPTRTLSMRAHVVSKRTHTLSMHTHVGFQNTCMESF